MGLMANRAAARMGARQQYRTMARMQRRRTAVQERVGMRQDFAPAGGDDLDAAPETPGAPAYVAELERLAELRDRGVISADDFDAKKRQLLGI